MRLRCSTSHGVLARVYIERVQDPAEPRLASLIAKSDAYLDALYPPESNHTEPLATLVRPGSAFFAGFIDASAVACGAAKVVRADTPYGEIKRLFVDDTYRGRGLAVTMMAHLERYVLDSGISTVRLEAGPLQPAALGLYRKLGYYERGPFGNYPDDPLSVFMEKALVA
ncbi:MAG: GNAT family N-acetyltransferase [Pseudomonadota bacterium]